MPRRTADQMIAVDEDDRFAAEVLAVVDSLERRQVVGLLSETHAAAIRMLPNVSGEGLREV